MSRNPPHTTTRARSAVIISRRRSSRSASEPANGATRKNGPVWSTSTSEVIAVDPVRSSARPSSATVANQSPAKLMSWAM